MKEKFDKMIERLAGGNKTKFAKMIGTSYIGVWFWETKTNNLKPNSLVKLYKAGINLNWLVDDSEPMLLKDIGVNDYHNAEADTKKSTQHIMELLTSLHDESLAEVADILGISHIFAYKLAAGERCPSLNVLAKMREKYKLNINWIVEG